jgi:hypothetical protein
MAVLFSRTSDFEGALGSVEAAMKATQLNLPLDNEIVHLHGCAVTSHRRRESPRAVRARDRPRDRHRPVSCASRRFASRASSKAGYVFSRRKCCSSS